MGFIHEQVQPEGGDRYRDVRCDGCDAPLQLVMAEFASDDQGRWLYLQPEDGLLVSLGGGYGMLIDPIGEPEPQVMFCRDCALALAGAHPAFARALAPHLPGVSTPTP